MKEPLIPFAQYVEYGKLNEIAEEGARVRRIRELVNEMDDLRKQTLKFLMSFFRQVVALEAHNKMTSYNIAVTTSPCIFRPRVMRADDLYKHAIYYDALLKMIQYHDAIFNDQDVQMDTGDNLRHG